MSTVKDRVRTATIPDRLAEVRAAAGLSAEKFAAELKAFGYNPEGNLSRTSVLDYEKNEGEKGATVAPAPYIAAVCRRFRWSEAYILNGVKPKRYATPDAYASAFERMAEIIEETREAMTIPPEQLDEYFPPAPRPSEEELSQAESPPLAPPDKGHEVNGINSSR